MDWHELEKLKVNELRDMAKEKTTLEGVSGMTKEHLIEALAKSLGIPKPHKVAVGQEKTVIKQQLKALKQKISVNLEKHDHAALKALRRQAHGLRRQLRKHARLAG